MSLSSRGRIVVSWDCGEDIVCGARFHSVECIALLSSTGPRKSAMDSKGVRRLYLLLRPKGRLSPGRKTPPGVSAPSAGPVRRPRPPACGRCLSHALSAGDGPCRSHSARSLTSLALMRTPKSANGPRSNSFRPDYQIFNTMQHFNLVV